MRRSARDKAIRPPKVNRCGECGARWDTAHAPECPEVLAKERPRGGIETGMESPENPHRSDG